MEMMHVITAVLGLAPTPLHHALAFEGATLAAVGAARRITEPHEAQFRRDRAVVLRGIHSCGLSPLQKLGDPQPSEMDGVDAEMRIAAALVSRLLRCLPARPLRLVVRRLGQRVRPLLVLAHP